MAGLINTKYYFIGGLRYLLFLFLLLIPRLTRGALYLSPPRRDDNPLPKKFTLTFNVDEDDDKRWEEDYEKLIKDLRTKLDSGRGRAYKNINVPVLDPQAPEGQLPTQWFHLVLQRSASTKSNTITWRIRGDNLYVVGFQRGGVTDDPWWECMEKKSLIKGSKPLGFSCNYNHVLKAAKLQKITDVGVGRHGLRDAIAQLSTARLPNEDSRLTARTLLVVAIMVSEATRFRGIADLFMVRVGFNVRQYLTPKMDLLVHAWADISDRIFRANMESKRGSTPPFPCELGKEVVLSTASEAQLELGILLLRKDFSPKSRILLLASVQGGTGTGHYAEGRPLLEVISVIINDINGKDPGQLYGTVRVTDALGAQFVYYRDRYNYEEVSPGKAATLTGLEDRAISALATITIDLDLWDRDFITFKPDNQVSKGTIEWDHLAFAKRYDTRLSQMVKGTYGSATVDYIVFSDAVEAKFEVTLVKGNDGQQGKVYGRIVAQIGDLGIESVLLSTTTPDYSQVWYGDRIPLQRTTVAVPLSSYIRVSALLYDYDSSSADDEIAGGSNYFGAKSYGTTRRRITGQSGEIEIKVTWNLSY